MFEVAYKEEVLKKCFVYPNFIINSQKKHFQKLLQMWDYIQIFFLRQS